MALNGTLELSRELANDEVWLCEPFSRGQAMLDLTLLANDGPRKIMVRGNDIQLKRGQLGWSIMGLSNRWQWSREKTRRFLEDLRDRRKITFVMSNTTTIISVLDYDLTDGKKTAEPTAELAADKTAGQTADPTQNRGTGESGMGNGGGPTVVPSEKEVADYCRDFVDAARGIRGIPEAWYLGWLAMMEERPFPKNWRGVMTKRFIADWVARHPKAILRSAKKTGAGGAARSRGEILQAIEMAIKNGRPEAEIEALRQELKTAIDDE